MKCPAVLPQATRDSWIGCERSPGHKSHHRKGNVSWSAKVPAALLEAGIYHGLRVRFTLDSLGVSEADDLGHTTGAVRGIGDIGTAAFPHPNQKGCPGWWLYEVDGVRRHHADDWTLCEPTECPREHVTNKLYVGASRRMVEPEVAKGPAAPPRVKTCAGHPGEAFSMNCDACSERIKASNARMSAAFFGPRK